MPVQFGCNYTCNLAGGALTLQAYPSGRVVTNTFNNDGSLANVSSKANRQQYQEPTQTLSPTPH